MKIRNNAKGFTLVEIMIVVAIIGLLAAIAVPNFVQARQTARTNTCVNNLRLIESAKEQYALEQGLDDGDAVTAANIQPYLKNNTVPQCPIGPTDYVITDIGTNQDCPNYDATTHAAQL
jgi:prepilin-type N-terminal cleavage/methylation domain-containing protein